MTSAARHVLRRVAASFLLLAVLVPSGARAHAPSLAYLDLERDAGGHAWQAVWDIALSDLDLALDLDRDRDGALTWGELRPRLGDVASFALPALDVSAAGRPCPRGAAAPTLVRYPAGVHVRLTFTMHCQDADTVPRVRYGLFHEMLDGHRVLVTHDAGVTAWSSDPRAARALVEPLSARLGGFVASGIHHILIGLDHLAFLAAVLIAATLTPAGVRGAARPTGRDPARAAGATRGAAPDAGNAAGGTSNALWQVAATLTTFTLAHSLTLALAALDILNLPPRPVEAAIAASIVVAGLYNLWPHPRLRPALLAFVFGLVHGLGFASVMAATQGGTQDLLLGLLGFNLGVEIGQLAFAAVLLPPLLFLARHRGPARGVGAVASIALAAAGAAWFVERAFGITLV